MRYGRHASGDWIKPDEVIDDAATSKLVAIAVAEPLASLQASHDAAGVVDAAVFTCMRRQLIGLVCRRAFFVKGLLEI